MFRFKQRFFPSRSCTIFLSTLLLLFKFTQNPKFADKDLVEYVKDFHKHLE